MAARPDLILFPSMYHGGLMQSYWAYSCRAFFVAPVAGWPSAIVTPVGQEIATTTNYFDFVTATINLDACVVHLDYNWKRLRDLKTKYGPSVTISDPGFLGSVLVSSEIDRVSVHELIREFEVETLDEYFARSRQHRKAHLDIQSGK